jgi:hypothetical protein
VWNITEGLQRLLAERGRSEELVQRYRCGGQGPEAVSADVVAASLEAGHPVVATLCYERTAALPAVAAQRRAACFSVAVVGVVDDGRDEYLVARDGLGDLDTCAAGADRLKPADIGLPAGRGPWSDPGTSVYRWAGANRNVVLTMVGSSPPNGGANPRAGGRPPGG